VVVPALASLLLLLDVAVESDDGGNDGVNEAACSINCMHRLHSSLESRDNGDENTNVRNITPLSHQYVKKGRK
jgi:hypothetical protein